MAIESLPLASVLPKEVKKMPKWGHKPPCTIPFPSLPSTSTVFPSDLLLLHPYYGKIPVIMLYDLHLYACLSILPDEIAQMSLLPTLRFCPVLPPGVPATPVLMACTLHSPWTPTGSPPGPEPAPTSASFHAARTLSLLWLQAGDRHRPAAGHSGPA